MTPLVRVALSIFLLGAAPFADAQTATRLKRIGVLTLDTPQNELLAGTGAPQTAPRLLVEGSKKLGWVEGPTSGSSGSPLAENPNGSPLLRMSSCASESM